MGSEIHGTCLPFDGDIDLPRAYYNQVPGEKTFKTKGDPIELLIVSDDFHQQDHSTPVLADFLRTSGYRVQVTQDFSILLTDTPIGYDALVLNTMDLSEDPDSLKPLDDTSRFSCSGKGYFLIHLAKCQMKEWPEYTDLAGGSSFKESTVIPPHGPFAVTMYPSGRPCVRGISSFVSKDELFNFGPVGYLGHVIAFTVDKHPLCCP